MKDQEVVIAYLQAFKWSQRKAINLSSYVNLERIILLGAYSSPSERQKGQCKFSYYTEVPHVT
jgi:hypothetical protein